MGKQCLKAAKKGNQILGMIRRTFSCKEKSIILKFYKSLVRPHLDYCIQAWRPHYQKDINMLEAVQKRATRMVTGLQETCYEARLNEFGLVVHSSISLMSVLLWMGSGVAVEANS